MTRIGSALFNADHTRLGDELRRTEAAGVDFFHLDVFDGYFVQDQAFPARTIKELRPLTELPFEVHLAVNDPQRFLGPLADAGADLVFLPAEATPLLYETIYAVREKKMKVGLCLALGTPLQVLASTLPMIDSVLLLGRVTGEGKRGRDFNQLVVDRVAEVRRMIDAAKLPIDLQAAGGLETANCVEVCQAGARSLPLGSALHRQPDMAAYLSSLREAISEAGAKTTRVTSIPSPARPHGNGTLNVLVASRSFGRNCPEKLEEMKRSGCVFVPQKFEKAPSEEQLVQAVREVDVIISGTEPITSKVLAAATRLKLIAKHGVGYDNIDVESARARGVAVALAGPVMVDSVADLAIGLLLAIARKIPQGNASVRSGQWDRFIGPELRDKTIGIVGFGQIGKAVARRAKSFGLRLLAHDTAQDPSFAASWGVRYADLDTLLAEADFISIHAPLTRETRHLFNHERLANMKRTAFLVNTARGELVDEAALFEALKSERIAGAATDVFATEPPGKNPLLQLDNFIATPHLGGQTPEALRRMGEVTAENVLRLLRGETPLHLVT
jgi:D-3-phosphoglycerate dehydrogenase / 2-oxoglutarate reductase